MVGDTGLELREMLGRVGDGYESELAQPPISQPLAKTEVDTPKTPKVHQKDGFGASPSGAGVAGNMLPHGLHTEMHAPNSLAEIQFLLDQLKSIVEAWGCLPSETRSAIMLLIRPYSNRKQFSTAP